MPRVPKASELFNPQFSYVLCQSRQGPGGVIMGSADRIDHAVVERWAKESGTLETWQDCLRRAGEE